MKPLTLLLAIICMPFLSFAQDITGLWKGTIFNDSTQQLCEYEIGISKDKGKYVGYSHTLFVIGNEKYHGIKKLKVKIAPDGKVIIEDDGLIFYNYPQAPNKNVRQLNVLNLEGIGENLKLQGPFVTSRTKQFAPLTGFVNLQRMAAISSADVLGYLAQAGQNVLASANPQ